MNQQSAVAAEVFVDGPLSDLLLADLIGRSRAAGSTGAQALFVGRVRADIHEGQPVVMLEYESYREMAVPTIHDIINQVVQRHSLLGLRLLHSLGRVETGEACFAVVAEAPHRGAAFAGCQEAVERIKKEVPIFAREHLADGGHIWKRNS